MTTIYAVYSGTLSGPSEATTEDPVVALDLARGRGPAAFVTMRSPGHGPARTVWTPEQDLRNVGSLIEAVVSQALAAVHR